MATILWSIGGIILLIALAYLFMRIEAFRAIKWRRRIKEFSERIRTLPPKISMRPKKVTGE